jgi:DNA mismatch endonuclease, patch repair protein
MAERVAVRRAMQGNRARDTAPEVQLRSLLHRAGLRFRKHQRLQAGAVVVRPDVTFPKAFVAVFYDGCYWHECPDHCRRPATNVEYWERKFARNRARDQAVDVALTSCGWTVCRIWQHVQPQEAARVVLAAVERARQARDADL